MTDIQDLLRTTEAEIVEAQEKFTRKRRDLKAQLLENMITSGYGKYLKISYAAMREDGLTVPSDVNRRSGARERWGR